MLSKFFNSKIGKLFFNSLPLVIAFFNFNRFLIAEENGDFFFQTVWISLTIAWIMVYTKYHNR